MQHAISCPCRTVGLDCHYFRLPDFGHFWARVHRGYFVLQVLLFGQMLYVCTGPSGLVLAMTGNEKTNLALTVLSLMTLLITLPVAAEYMGLLGLVIALSVVLVARNIASLIAVRQFIGINILTGKYHPVESMT